MSLEVNLMMVPGGPAPRHKIRANPTGTASAIVYVDPNFIALCRHPELLEAYGDAFHLAARDLRLAHEDLIAEPMGSAEVTEA